MIAVDVAGYSVVEVETHDETYFRTEGLGRSMHPELAVGGANIEAARVFLAAMVERIQGGSLLDLPSGRLTWQGMSWTYRWKPELFLFWFAQQ